MADLVSTGIEGLDSLLNGGIPQRSTVLVSGRPGTGKTLCAMQYLYTGVVDENERVAMVSYEESREDIRGAAHSIGFDQWAEFVENGDIVIDDKRDMLAADGFTAMIDKLLETIESGQFDRFVLDSVSMFQLLYDDEREQREYLLKFSDILKQNGLTALLVAEESGQTTEVAVGLENYLTDGNIRFIQTPTPGGVNRYVWVTKMRRQAIDTDIYPIEIGRGGITVHEQAGDYALLDTDPRLATE